MDLRKILGALALLPLIAACTPDSPQTQLSWGVNDHLKPHRHTAGPKYVARDTAKTYVYQGDAYAVPAPKPRPTPPSNLPPPQRATYQPSSPATGSLAFAWPVKGKVISGFGATTGGERNDGINIAAARGTPIRASASGTVSYAGDELKDYGNLLLIKHADGYVTAYAHADHLIVAKGDTVTKGQVIGYAGQTGDVSTPQLHFEIRHGTQPVNPSDLLVARSS